MKKQLVNGCYNSPKYINILKFQTYTFSQKNIFSAEMNYILIRLIFHIKTDGKFINLVILKAQTAKGGTKFVKPGIQHNYLPAILS